MALHRFTDRWILSCTAPSDRRLEFVDAICPCLHLRVSSRTKTFSAVFRVSGKLQRRTIGRYPRIGLAQAREATLALLRNAAEGGFIKERAKPKPPTYKQAVDLYDERHLIPNVRSRRNIATSLRASYMKHLFERPIESVTKADIIEVLDGIMARGMPQAAINQLRNLKMLFNWLSDRDVLEVSPCDRIRRPARPVERDRVLDDGEIAAVWNATFELEAPYGEMYRMFLLTGQRRTEVATMEWSEVKDDLWVIPREKVKKDRAHAVPLSRTALALIAELRLRPMFAGGTYAFSTTGGVAPSSNFAKTKRRLDQLSGVTGWTIHDIRRTVRSKLAELRVPREVARKVLNHEDGKVDRIYNRHEYLAEKREALEKWERMLLSLI